MKSKSINIFVSLLCLIVLSSFKSDKTITVFMIGDSTMANKPFNNGNLERGWGMVLSGFFTEDIKVDNHALNGRSSKSFIDEGHWQEVIDKVRPGDYVFIQFGHNDEKPKTDRHTDPGTTFDANLRRFCKETIAKGGHPVLFNSIVRRNFYDNKNAITDDDVRKDKQPDVVEHDSLIDTHGAYLSSPRNVAVELGVPFVDANKITHDLVQGMGVENSKKLFMWVKPGLSAACPKGRQDNTHLNIWGARKVAGLIIDEVAKKIPSLGKYVRHYDLVVAKDGSGDYFDVQKAVNAAVDGVCTTIMVRGGTYAKPVVPKNKKIKFTLLSGVKYMTLSSK
jgi:pectinesterase